MASFTTQATPNPNSIKITSEEITFIEQGMESFNSAEEAAGHPLGSRLFGIEGIANVFIVPQFLTVTKQPAAEWDVLMRGVMSILEAELDT